FVTAVGLVAEVGDIRRFTHPRELMAYLGLVPSEHASGPSVRRGGITKAGNPHARRLLAEAAWAYQGVPRLGRQMLYRQEASTTLWTSALPTRPCLGRGSSATNHSLGGTQPADISSVNRR